MRLVIPVKLGPRTQLWDVAFEGVKHVSEKEVAEAAQVPIGEYVSTSKLDDTRRRIIEWYKDLGYAFVDVKYTLEPSLDNTRARVRFDVTENDQVIVSSIVVRGLQNTRESVVRRRIGRIDIRLFRTRRRSRLLLALRSLAVGALALRPCLGGRWGRRGLGGREQLHRQLAVLLVLLGVLVLELLQLALFPARQRS